MNYNQKTIILINVNNRHKISYYNPKITDITIDFEQLNYSLQKNDYLKYPPNETLINLYIQLSLNEFFSNDKLNRCFLIVRKNSDKIKENLLSLNNKLKIINS